jgi:hypothetical protein
MHTRSLARSLARFLAHARWTCGALCNFALIACYFGLCASRALLNASVRGVPPASIGPRYRTRSDSMNSHRVILARDADKGGADYRRAERLVVGKITLTEVS